MRESIEEREAPMYCVKKMKTTTSMNKNKKKEKRKKKNKGEETLHTRV